VYGRAMREEGTSAASACILKRAWQVYVAYTFWFAIYTAEISHVAHSFENPLYHEGKGIFEFLQQPQGRRS
jgi:OpgC protein